MKFYEDWTKKNDVKLKGFHECDWEDSCVMCKNFNECESEMKNESTTQYKIELWAFRNKIDEFETNDFETAKYKFKAWFNDYDNNSNKGHTMFYVNNELMSIEWTYKNILGVN